MALLTTGATDIARAYNIYDIAGNLYEFTEEIQDANTSNIIYRGGCFGGSPTHGACSKRWNEYQLKTDSRFGFRVMLYIM